MSERELTRGRRKRFEIGRERTARGVGFPSRWVGAVLVLSGGAALGQEVRHEKYKLDNGMTVILHEDHSLPVGAINLWYRVGSKDEPKGRSGFAHLFEHLMFMGTERVPGNKFDTIMEGAGGSNNASTSSDRTNYFSNGPAQLVPTLLWLDADRLEDLARTMDQEKLDKQRDVVRNERRQSYENRPYGKAELKLPELLYPVEHPYHIPVIGTHEDLEAATVADVKDFFGTYYVANNVNLCVAGDFDSAKMKQSVSELFASLPKKGDAPRRNAGPVKLDKVIRATTYDKVPTPKTIFAYHSPGQYAEGDAEMHLIAAVLSEGKTSRLYKRLIYDERIASEVNAYQDASQLGSVFRIDVVASPGVELDRIEKAVDEELTKLLEMGVGEPELEQRKAMFELGMLSGLQSIEAKADQLNEYEYFWGEPNSFQRDLDRFRGATVASVRQWAKQVLTPGARVILRVMPESTAGGAPSNGPKTVEKTPAPAATPVAEAETLPRSASARDKQPAIGAAKPFNVDVPLTFKLDNGIPVMLWTKRDLPLAAMTVLFRPGHIIGTWRYAGATYLCADMLDEGAGSHDALEFSDAVQSLGASFGTTADRESIHVSLTVLKRNFEKAAALASDAIRKPRFKPEDWDRVRKLHLEELQQQDDQPTVVAAKVANRLLFGETHVYGLPVMGTPEAAAKFELDDVRLPYVSFVRPEFATVLVAGDLTEGEAKTALNNTLGKWKLLPLSAPNPTQPALPERKAMQVVVVDRPDAVQTVIHFAMPGPKMSDQFRVPYRLLNTLFGGSFTSRLNMNLREEHGYTYGARSGFVMRQDLGYVTASSSVRADATGEALKEFLKEFQRVRGGDISEEETTKARETYRTDVIQSFAGLNGVLQEATQRLLGGLHYETLARDMGALQSAKTDELNKIAHDALPMEKGVLVLVGDKKVILEEIKDLGLPTPTDVDVRGAKVGS